MTFQFRSLQSISRIGNSLYLFFLHPINTFYSIKQHFKRDTDNLPVACSRTSRHKVINWQAPEVTLTASKMLGLFSIYLFPLFILYMFGKRIYLGNDFTGNRSLWQTAVCQRYIFSNKYSINEITPAQLTHSEFGLIFGVQDLRTEKLIHNNNTCVLWVKKTTVKKHSGQTIFSLSVFWTVCWWHCANFQGFF